MTYMMKIKIRKSQLLERPWTRIRLCIWHIIKQLQWKMGWKNISRKCTLSSGDITVEKMFRNRREVHNHVYETWNQAVLNGPQKIRWKNWSWRRRWKIRKYSDKAQQKSWQHYESESWKVIELKIELKQSDD